MADAPQVFARDPHRLVLMASVAIWCSLFPCPGSRWGLRDTNCDFPLGKEKWWTFIT